MKKSNYGDYSPKVIARARLLHQRGYGGREIKKHLADEGHRIPESTIESWIYSKVRAHG